MKIWFGTTTLKFKEYKDYYLKIRDYIISSKHQLTDDWIGTHGKWLEENPYATRDIKDVYQKVIKAIDLADVSIIEFTVPNFSTSHQITYSLSKHKPTLVMRLKKDNTFGDSYIEAINSPYLSVLQYNLKNYKEILNDFTSSLDRDSDFRRYNLMLSRRHKYYLDWAATKYNKSKSELVRDLIDSKIKTDSEFSK